MGPESSQASPQGQRTLAAIVFSDGVNFSGRMSRDEEHTLRLMQRDIALMTRLCEQFEGRVLKSTGDGLLMYFTSAVQAVACALEIQESIATAAADLPASDVLQHRIGIHLGDVFVSATDVMGDGVNIAARLQSEAEPGGICLSQIVYDVVKKRLAFKATYLGPRELKHIQEAVPIYQIVLAAHTKAIDPSQMPQTVSSLTADLEHSPQSRAQNGLASEGFATDAFKQALEQLLTKEIGPIASVMVAQALKQTRSIQALVDQLVIHLPEDKRQSFQAAVSRLLPQSSSAAKQQPDVEEEPCVASPSTPTATAIDPAFAKRCEHELAKVIGPIAGLMVRRTLSQEPALSRTQLVESLATHVPNATASEAFRRELLASP